MTEMVFVTVFLGIAAMGLFGLYYRLGCAWMLSAAVTFLTVFYHFLMRLIVGETITVLYRGKQFPQESLGFHIYGFEEGLYKKLKVKQWKLKMITAKPEQFDMRKVGPEELLHNVMQAELVHRLIMLLSFVPLLFIIPFGSPAVFAVTSVLACMFDGIFVVIQRYNRPRVMRYKEMIEKRSKE